MDMYKSRLKIPDELIIPSNQIKQIDRDRKMLQSSAGRRNSLQSSAGRKKNTFLTQSNKKPTNQQQIKQNHHQLNKYIERIQQKVQKIIQSHDSKFLLAYKTHINYVKQEIQQIKNQKTKDQDQIFKHVQKTSTLQKQMIIFREQALKFFNRLTQKQKQVQTLKMKIYQLQCQKKFNNRTIINLLKKNKQLELKNQLPKINNQIQCQTQNQQNQYKSSLSILTTKAQKKMHFQSIKETKNLKLKQLHSFFRQNYSIGREEKENKPIKSTKTTIVTRSRVQTTLNLNTSVINDLKSNFSSVMMKNRSLSKILKKK